LFLPAAALLAAAAAAEPVAMVTDLEGKAWAEAGGGKEAVGILYEIEAGTRVQVEPGARLVAVYLKGGEEFSFRGPASAVFGSGGPEALSGEKPRARGALPAGRINLSPAGRRALVQSAVVMRGGKAGSRIRLLTLNGSRSLDAQPEFRWQAVEGARQYQVEIMDDAGRTVFEAAAQGASLRLPDELRLEEGVPYTWAVSTRLPDGRKYSNSGDFSLASGALRAEAAALRPPADAPVSARVAYAAWLEQVELRDEARRYWKAIAAERRDDPRIRALAGD
jgi:hypothetical protein